MDADGKGFKAIARDANGLRTVFASTLEQTETLKKSLINWSAAVQGLQSVDSAVNQISNSLNAITRESEDFNKAMREANTMAGKNSAGFNRLKGEVADLAKEIPIARDQLANGLYQTISNGVPENNWIEFLNTSARSAVGGLADINKVVGVTSTVIKNYGLEWSAAADIQDKIQLTAKNGVTSFEQLAQALPRVTGNAATLDVSIEELLGSFATLTGVSGNTAEVSTQLAAIFTALVKPSSEAAEMAANMGIQFDAAAIKCAGGFQNFLKLLDGSVKAYAQATGALEQEVYSKLFGSAEALRALIPLQGELADKFTQNVANMVNSAGTMDAAFEEMSSPGEAVNLMLRSQWAAITDVVSGFTSAAKPYIDFSAGLLSTTSSAAILITTFKQLNIQQTLVAARAKLGSVVMTSLGLSSKSSAAMVRVFSASLKSGAYSATAFKIALRGLLITTGVGIAIAAVTAVIEYFVNATDDAADATNDLIDAEQRARREAEQLEQLRQQEASTLTQTRAALELNIGKLREFNGTKEQERRLVSEMNNTYGETMGYFSSVADWYNALISNSEAYCRQMVIEARTRMLANQIAQKEQEIHDATYDEAGNERVHSEKRETTTGVIRYQRIGGEVIPRYGPIEIVGSSPKEQFDAMIEEESAKIEHLKEQIKAAMEEAAGITFSVRGSDTRPNDMRRPEQNGNASGQNAPVGSIADLDNQIRTVTAKLNFEVDAGRRTELYKELRELEDKKHQIEFSYKFPEVPDRPDILPGLDTTLETDIAKIKPVIEDVSDAFVDMGDKAGRSTKGMADAVGQLGASISGLGNALEIPELDVAGTMVQAIATMVSGYAEATAQGAALGPLGWIAFAATGLAQLTSMVSAVKGLPAFANGGIVSGPTVGLIGEYAGASSNPEVVAPLDRLRGMLNPVGEPVIIGGTLRASGRDIVCVLANETRISSKSGRRTNIKI